MQVKCKRCGEVMVNVKKGGFMCCNQHCPSIGNTKRGILNNELASLNNRIKIALELGYSIKSRIPGRIGEITGFNPQAIYPIHIKSRDGEKVVTSFEDNSDCGLVKVGNRRCVITKRGWD